MKNKNLTITLIRSGISRQPTHRATLIGLGLKKLNQVVTRKDTPEIRGMIKKVSYLIKVEES